MSTTHTLTGADKPNDNPPAPRYRTIPVRNGPDALCDEEDFAFLSLLKWRSRGKPPSSYPTIRLAGTEFPMHQLVIRDEKTFKVNHRDGNMFNNCRANLRLASHQQIAAASSKSGKRPFTSSYKGVCWCKRDRKWGAQITVGGIKRWLGTFSDEEKAARAYNAAAFAAFGEFAFLNFEPNRTPLEPLPLPSMRQYPSLEAPAEASGPQTIPVVNGPFAICDPKDFVLLSNFTWYEQQFGAILHPLTHLCGHTILMHDLVLRRSGKQRIIHRDGNPFNNCRENLRTPHARRIPPAKTLELKPRSVSRYKGVWKPVTEQNWTSTIIVAGTPRHLGNFANEEDAARAYDKAAREAFGSFANLNFPLDHQ